MVSSKITGDHGSLPGGQRTTHHKHLLLCNTAERMETKMKKAGERRVTLGFWRSDIAAYEGFSKRSNGNYYATYVLLYNDNTYECVSVNLGKYYEIALYIHCDELYGIYDRLHDTKSYKSILGSISCVGVDHYEALKIIREKSKAWRKVIKDYDERSYKMFLKAKPKTNFRMS